MAAKKKSIEESMKRLDEISELMTGENVTLEASFALFREGMDLVKECRSQLAGVEKQMKILEEEENASLSE